MWVNDWRLAAISAMLVLGGCTASPVAELPQPQPAPEHSSQQSLDWQGRYHGVLPCADCAGIYVTIDVGDLEYQYRAQYLGAVGTTDKATRTEFLSQGQIKWNAAGSHIELQNMDTGPAFYQVAEGALVQKDMQGREIVTEHPSLYRLPKQQVTGQHRKRLVANEQWMLTALNGTAISEPAADASPIHIAFNDNGIAYGFSGCNRFRGSYQLETPARLSFGPLVSTKLACPQQSQQELIETTLNELLTVANGYILNGERLLIFSQPTGISAYFRATSEAQ